MNHQILYHYHEPKMKNAPHWHYAHGDAEVFMEYDLLGCENKYIPKLGRSVVILQNLKGEQRKAFCFSWIDEYKTQRGLIVFLDDRESISYASQCLMNKVSFL